MGRRVAIALVMLAAGCGDDRFTGNGALIVTPTAGLEVSEMGTKAMFSVVMGMQPTANVHVTIDTSEITEAGTSPATITFDPINYDQPVIVTVRGSNDPIDDGDQLVTIHLDAGSYGSADVVVTNEDDDTRGVTVTADPDLTTTEAGGVATFKIVLVTQPTAPVTFPITSSSPGEGVPSPDMVTFTDLNWNIAKTVTVTGTNDDLADGTASYAIAIGAAVTSDPVYAGLDPDDVALRNTDDDTAGIAVTPTTGLVTTEAGGTATFTVVLTSEPTGDVTIPVASSQATEATVSTDLLVFTPSTWSTAQTVTITGVDDGVPDGSTGYRVVLGAATSTDLGYAGIDPSDVDCTNE